jgi:putative transposase
MYNVLVKTRYRFRFYPTPDQEAHLARTFGACRFVYNWALRQRTDAFHRGEKINYNRSSAMLTALKKTTEHGWLNEISCVPTQQALRHLQTAFDNFFDKRSKYPGFKKKKSSQSAEYTTSAFKWSRGTQSLTIAKIGRLDVRWSREFTSSPTTVTITKSAVGHYFVTLCLDEDIQPLPKTDESVGIDLGVSRLATLSNGERIANPKNVRKYETKLAKAQRVLARRKKGSNRRNLQRIKVAKIQEKIANCRKDHVHKVTTDIVRRFDLIVTEDLNVRGMVRNHKLAKSISDAAFGMFDQFVAYKAEWYGKTHVRIDRFFPSSKRCHCCGHIVKSLPLDIRSWVCPECGKLHDRDENASCNILAAGQTVTAQGGHVSPGTATAVSGNARRTANRSKSRS